MRRIVVITFFVIVTFMIEFFLFNSIGGWVVPNLSLLLVIFFNLYLGIRYSLFTALLAGLVKDSFSTNVFGLSLCSFVVSAYMTTILKQYIYHMGSRLSRYILIFAVIIVNVAVYYSLYRLFEGIIPFSEVLRFNLMPQIVMTMAAAPFAFRQMKQCVSRLFV
jgi:rod shape-determining protein MreD